MVGYLAQSSENAAGVVIAILFLLAVFGLQIYLIYAIIATRHDVRAIRRSIDSRSGVPPPFGAGRAVPPSIAAPERLPPSTSGPTYIVRLMGSGKQPEGVARMLVSMANLSESDAYEAVRNPGRDVTRLQSWHDVEALMQGIKVAGGSADVRFVQGAAGETAPPSMSVPDPPSPGQGQETKTCPDCAEDVKVAARKCRYCGFEFTAGGT